MTSDPSAVVAEKPLRVLRATYRLPDQGDPLTDDYATLLRMVEHIWMAAPSGKAYRHLTDFILDREEWKVRHREPRAVLAPVPPPKHVPIFVRLWRALRNT